MVEVKVTAGGRIVGVRFKQIPVSGSITTLIRHFVADHLGSIAVITDAAGQVVERLSYDGSVQNLSQIGFWLSGSWLWLKRSVVG